jgi:hypothetical protein
MTVVLAAPLTIVLLAVSPASAQGITNNRDGGGNLSRDKGVSASTMQRGAIVGSAVQPVPIMKQPYHR